MSVTKMQTLLCFIQTGEELSLVFFINTISHTIFPRAAAYQSLNKHKEAAQDCRKAISLDYTYSKAFVRLAKSEELMGDIEGAKVCICLMCFLKTVNVIHNQHTNHIEMNFYSYPFFSQMTLEAMLKVHPENQHGIQAYQALLRQEKQEAQKKNAEKEKDNEISNLQSYVQMLQQKLWANKLEVPSFDVIKSGNV